MSLAIFIKSAGDNVNKDNLKDTLTSIIEKTKEEFKIYLVLEESQKSVLKEMNIDEYLLDVKTANNNSWAYDFNIFYDSVKNKFDWLLYSHDDLKILTDEWFSKSKQLVKDRDDIGWISYSQPTWYMFYNEPRSQVARPGFHLDRFEYPCMHEGHNFNRSTDFNKTTKYFASVLDMPKKPVKIHGPYSVFNLIEMEKMNKIGYCEDWNPYTMLIDEDWALESLKNNLVNVWIPNIFYEHPLRFSLRKSPDRYKNEAKDGFYKKWGFHGGTANISDDLIQEICDEYKDTNIPWSKDRLSYDWDYIK